MTIIIVELTVFPKTTKKLRSIYDNTSKVLTKEKTSRDLDKWRLEVQRQQAEALRSKDRASTATQPALVASQQKQVELEEQVKKRDKWIKALEGWISTAFGFMNAIVSRGTILSYVTLTTK